MQLDELHDAHVKAYFKHHAKYATPVAMPNLGEMQEMTLEDYFKRLQQIPDVMLKQVSGNHYQQGSIPPTDIFLAWGLDPFSANVVKYILRFPYKGKKQDIEKLIHYAEMILENYDEIEKRYYMDKDTNIKSMKE